MSSLIKETNGLVNKGIYVLLFDVFNKWLPSLIKEIKRLKVKERMFFHLYF